MSIIYNHLKNQHSSLAPVEALAVLFEDYVPSSVLDLGCGPGRWLNALSNFGITDILGVDGIDMISRESPNLSKYFKLADFSKPLELGRHFDAAICLEVAEHLSVEHATNIITILTDSSNLIYFSAACPGQPGQHHVNCQWPSHWQGLFNERGFVCSDAIRWRIWENGSIEPWYRQNLFVARKCATEAGKEPRIRPVVHPEIVALMIQVEFEQCTPSLNWLRKAFLRSTVKKLHI